MPAEVKLQLDVLLRERDLGMTKVELAKQLGISEGTLRGYCENRWTVLDRTVMERMADIFQCDAKSLLTTSENRFFEAFQSPSNPNYLCLVRPDAKTLERGREVAFRDNRAIGHVGQALEDCVPGISLREDTATTPEQFEESLLKNCIVVGSPSVNPASEMAICRVFSVTPFDSSQSSKLPFTFKVAGTIAQKQSSILETSEDGRQGIWLREKGELVEADLWPRAEFRALRIPKARDCAVVVVWNHHPAGESDRSRKLIILSGSSGVGTEAAAMALVDQYRDFEPLGSGPVWGILEVLYKKRINTESRQILSSYWRYRVGGRFPVDFAKRRA